MPMPVGYDAASMEPYHIHDGQETLMDFTVNDDNTISFTTSSFSTFVFAQNEDGTACEQVA